MQDDIEIEFDMVTRRAGLTVPPERRPALLQAFRDFREQIQILHGPRSHLAEISNIFVLPKPGAAA
jgi:hypothetical protein